MENNDNKTVEKDELTGDKLLSGHEYDNIRELDNRLPLWWVWLFIITIVFAAAYIFVYDVFKVAPHQQEEYKNEIAEAGTLLPGQPAMPATDLIALTDQASLDEGQGWRINRESQQSKDGGGHRHGDTDARLDTRHDAL